MRRSPISIATGTYSISLALWLFLSSAYADTDLEALEGQLEMASTFVTEIDARAGRCLEAGATSTACSEFRLAINAESLAHYQTLCEPLIRWRDGMIFQRSSSGDDAAALATLEAERTVRLLLKLEERCGSRALTQRTKHIMAAYSLSTKSSERPSSASQSATTKVERQRSDLLDSLSDSHNRLRVETTDLWRRLQIENELRMQQKLRVNLSNPSLQ